MTTIPDETLVLFVRDDSAEFRVALNSKRLRRLLGEVWVNIPADARNGLNDSIRFVTDNRLFADLLNGDLHENYGGAFLGCRWFIVLDARVLQYRSDSDTRHVIAHEFAHVYHNHSSKRYKRMEAEANQTAAIWGYPEMEYK